MALTPAQYTVFNTIADTTMSAVWSTDDAEITHERWATTHPMTEGAQIAFGWTGRMPKPRPWFGSRMLFEPAAQTYTVSPIPYELTYTQDRFILEDSNANTLSIFWRTLPDMAFQWRRHPEYELRDLIENSGIQTGPRQLGLDGLSFFNSSHPIDIYNPGFNAGGMFTAGTYCNDFTGGGVSLGGITVGGAFSQTSFASLLEYMQMIPSEDGETLGVRPNFLMAPQTLQVEVNFVLKASFMAAPQWGAWSPLTGQVGTADNQLAKMGIMPIFNPFLKSTTKWYLGDNKRAFKPMIWCVREAPRTVPRVQENDPLVWDSHRFAWGGWDRAMPAWGPSFLMSRSGP